MSYIGIDLGTTNSCMAIAKDGNYEILTNKGNERLTSSYVFVQDIGVSVGLSAYKQSSKLPRNCVYEVKRLMGYEYDDRYISMDKMWMSYQISRGENNEIGIKFDQYEQQKSPIEISAFILHKLKRDAEEKLKTKQDSVVVTVPAYFNSVQKAATKLAARIAGFDVVKLLNEPTAAALSYLPKLQAQCNKNPTIMVFDLGGGTFDVSIVEIADRTVTVKSVYGDSHLGGEMFLRILIKFVIKKIMEEYPKIKGITDRSQRRIRMECEEAKKQLTFYESYDIIMEYFEGEEQIQITITREKYDEFNNKLYDRALEIMDVCIKNSNAPKENIDKVLLVGGASFTPKIRQLLKEYFHNEDILETNISSDEAVALGAAMQAYSIFSPTKEGCYYVRDVVPMSIGIIINNGEYIKYIEKNSPIPVECSQVHDIVHLSENSFLVSFYEGQSGRSILLGAKRVKLLDEADEVTIKIRVEDDEVFKVTISGSCIEELQFDLQVRGTLDNADIIRLRKQVECQLIN